MAVGRCELVLAVTPGAQARAALDGVLDALGDQAVYADLSTGSPGLKGELAAVVAGRGACFAGRRTDVTDPGSWSDRAPLVSRSGAKQFADSMNARGGNVEVVGARAGEARRANSCAA
ncbi:MAG: hypothetical protein ACRDWS_09125 [Acidimicrobiia bacterium]